MYFCEAGLNLIRHSLKLSLCHHLNNHSFSEETPFPALEKVFVLTRCFIFLSLLLGIIPFPVICAVYCMILFEAHGCCAGKFRPMR